MRTRNIWAIVALAIILTFVNVRGSFGQADNTATTWLVTGAVSGVPGSPPVLPFACNVTEANRRCNIASAGKLQVDFFGVDADSFTASLASGYVAGATIGVCQPIFDDGTLVDQVDSLTCSGGLFTVAARSKRGRFPCPDQFSGLQPSFNLTWNAKATCTTSTTSTSTSTTTTST